MPEGPSIVFIKQQLAEFEGRTVTAAGGYGPMKTSWLKGEELLSVQSWGKHLLLHFSNASVRIHLMLFGSMLINKKKKVNATFFLKFGKEEVNFYVVNAKKIEEPLDEVYDWRTDIMSAKYSAAYVKKLLADHDTEYIADVLLNQDVFTGVGNIIRNEVLYRQKIHPLSVIKNIPAHKITALLKETRSYAKEFLKEKKAGTFGNSFEVHEQKLCHRDDREIIAKNIGKTKRKGYFCNECQVKYEA